MPILQNVNTTYEPFSREPEYLEANKGFVQRVPLAGVDRFLDLACGTGTVSRMLLEETPGAFLNGVDLDPVQIDLAAEEFAQSGFEVRRGFDLVEDVVEGKPVVVLAVGSANELPFPDGTFGCVTIANAIHMMPDKEKFLREAHRVLRPGGLFGFNSSFYAGTYPTGTERHGFLWLREATLFIDRLNQQLKAEGRVEELIRRVHGTTRAAFQNRWYSRDEWSSMLKVASFAVRDVHERVVMMDERCLAAVGAYGGLAEVLMSGYPVETASMALQATAGTGLKALNIDAVPRNWLEIWAVKQ
jgi:ubiquinone/menaquinone biosynthesis C-methylase UbiE